MFHEKTKYIVTVIRRTGKEELYPCNTLKEVQKVYKDEKHSGTWETMYYQKQ